MLGIAAATAVLNAALDALGYALLGPVGIVVSTVLVRWTMAGVYLHCCAPSSRRPSARSSPGSELLPFRTWMSPAGPGRAAGPAPAPAGWGWPRFPARA
jgi:hypothetical protein